MKKVLLVIVTAIVLSGCASSSGKPVEVVNADRAGGVVLDWPPESPDNQYHLNK